MSELFIGLMSGTSLDGVDGVLIDFATGRLQVLAHQHAPFDTLLRSELLALNQSISRHNSPLMVGSPPVMRSSCKVLCRSDSHQAKNAST